MNDTINVPRELLRSIWRRMNDMMQGDMVDKISAILQAPAHPAQVQGWQIVGYARKDELEPLLSEAPVGGKHIRIGLDHPICWADEPPYEWLTPLYIVAAPKPPVQECEAPSCGCADAYCKAWDEAPQPSDDVVKDALVVAASAALLEIECLMKEAYNSATPVCCQRAGQECCGDSLPEWSEYDQRTMDRFAPHQRALNEALRAIDAAMAGGGV